MAVLVLVVIEIIFWAEVDIESCLRNGLLHLTIGKMLELTVIEARYQ